MDPVSAHENASPLERAFTLGATFHEKLDNGVELFVAPRHVVQWEDFDRIAPPYSIALDGYVYGAPRYNPKGPRLNLNHHEEVDRLGTRSTCGQVHMNLKQGMLEAFSERGRPCFRVFVNDPDQDVSTAVWLLRNHKRVAGFKREPAINRLVQAEDLIDTTAGAYPFDPRSRLVRKLTWIFDPYTQSRVSGRLYQAIGAEMAGIICEVDERISRYAIGRGEEMELDTRFETIGGGEGWSMIREVGPGARTGLYQSGVLAFVSVSELGNGRYKYSIGKMSPFVFFPVLELYDVLNKFERIPDSAPDKWGGGDIIGGSPRLAGSELTPGQVIRIINSYLTTVQNGKSLHP